MFLLLHIKSNIRLEELYFIGAEVIPTCLMLYIFRGSDEESEAVSDLGEGQPEYKLLRASIKDTLDIAPSKDSRFRSLKNSLSTGKSFGKKVALLSTFSRACFQQLIIPYAT